MLDVPSRLRLAGLLLLFLQPLAVSLQPSASAATNDLTSLLQQGLFEEEANRDLDAAIASYQSLAAKFDKDRQVAATAVFRLGECYRKLGRTNDAAVQYERVVREFPDQQTLATLSRQNLAGMGIQKTTAGDTIAGRGAQPGVGSLPDEARQLAAKLASLEKFKGDPEQYARAVVTLFPDAALQRMLEHLPRLRTQEAKLKADPNAELDGFAVAIDANGGLLDLSVPAPGARLEKVGAEVRKQLAFIAQRVDYIVGNQQARLQVLQTVAESSTPGPTSVTADATAKALAAAEAAEAEAILLASRLERLKEMSHDRLRVAIQQDYPNPVLTKLMQDLADAEQKVTVLGKTATETNPEMVNARALINTINQQIDEQIEGVLIGLKTKAEIARETAMTLRAQMEKTQSAQAKTDASSPAATVLTDEEEQEIRRIQAMIQNSPDLINASGGDELTPLCVAARNGQLRVASFLLANGADVNRAVGGWSPLHYAADAGHKAMVELLLGKGAPVNARDRSGNTPLHLATKKGLQAVVETLLASEADVNIRNNFQTTSLHDAAVRSSGTIAALLIQNGADVNAKNNVGATPLSLAAQGGHHEVVSQLLAGHADVNIRDNSGNAPLHAAAGGNRWEIVQQLIAAGAEVNARNASDQTPLLWAASGPSPAPQAVKALLEAKADPNLVSSENHHQGWGPLHYAVDKGNAEIVEALLRHGANPDTLTGSYQSMPGPGRLVAVTKGCRPLGLAIDADHPDIVNLLLQFKADPNLSDASGVRPLARTLEAKRSVAMTRALLDAGANPNTPVSDGWWPLPLAVVSGNKALVETVLAFHPDINTRNQGGFTALERTRGRPELAEIAALLRQHGALEDLPDFNCIRVVRPSTEFSVPAFWKDSNNWNQFSLLELIATHYGFLSANPRPNNRPLLFDQHSRTYTNSLQFPNFERIVIRRPEAEPGKWKAINVNLEDVFKSADCRRDVKLQWGDVVEIPEADHPIKTDWSGFSREDRNLLQTCLKRQVTVSAKGQTTNLLVMPNVFGGPTVIHTAYGGIEWTPTQCTLRPSLENSGLLRTSSDLSRVKVTRLDPKTGQKLEWVLDCSGDNAPDLWLRDGDVIEVPEK
jgi:cytohesin